MPDTITAREYHERTKHSPRSLRESGHRLDFTNKPTPYKVYEDLPTRPLADRVRPPQIPALAAIAESTWTPGSDLDSDGDSNRVPEVDLGALTQLCYYSAGTTKKLRRGDRDLLFRAAATTGALYHVDLYAVAGELPELDAGVYHFDPRTLSLDVLRKGDYRGVLADATGGQAQVADAPLTFVATSTWWRNAWKYRERTYRHALWDSGTTLANLLAVAHALDLPAGVVAGFADERVANLLGVDVEREAPLELIPVGAGGPVSDAPAVESIDPATQPLSPREERFDLIPAAYRGSSLPDGAAAREWRTMRLPSASGRTSSEGRSPSDHASGRGPRADGERSDPRGAKRPANGVGTREPGGGDRVELDPVSDSAAAKTPLHRTIRRRGSCRKYDRETLNFRKVSTVLDRAVRGFPADFRDPDGPPLQLTDCYLVVHDLADVPSGAYHYHPEAGELELLRGGDFREAAGHLALDQRLAADAGLCAFFLADLDAVTERLGDRGYRAAQLEAALTAGKLYLGAYAHRDLGATGLTFYDDLVTEFFEPRAEGQTPMFLWTLGRPA